MPNIVELPSVEMDGHEASTDANADHPMRLMTRRAAGLTTGEWDSDAAATVAELFDSLAAEWHTRSSPQRLDVVTDAMERGLDRLREGTTGGTAIEVGSGLGAYSALIDARFAVTLAVEIAQEMHRRADRSRAHRVLADASRLPVADASVDAVVMVNAFLFPHELDRVLKTDGVLLWANLSGTSTPIHLSTDDVASALAFDVTGVQSRTGVATWCALRRHPWGSAR